MIKKFLLSLALLAGASSVSVAQNYNPNTMVFVSSVDALKNLNPFNLTSQTIYLQSYHEGLNKGGGEFIWVDSSCTPDNGLYIQSNRVSSSLGCWVRQLNNTYLTPEMFGAYGDGGSASPHDDTAALQAAADAISVHYPIPGFIQSQSETLRLSCNSQYLVTGNGWDLTSTRQNGDVTHDGLHVEGCGYSSQIIGETGNLAAIDVTGSQWIHLENFWVYVPVGTTNGSCVGIFDGINAVNPQSQNQVFDNIRIALDNNTSCNTTLGSVGFWDFGAEENTWKNIYVTAVTPMIFTGHNAGTGNPSYPTAGTSYPYSPLLTDHSLGVSTFLGESFLQSVNGTGQYSDIILNDVNSFNYGNLYLGTESTASGASAISVIGIASNSVEGSGTMEGFGTWISSTAILTNANLSITVGATNSSAQDTDPIINLVSSGQGGTFQNSRVAISYSAAFNRPTFALSGNTAGTLCTCGIQNSEFFDNLGTESLWLPPQALLAATSGTVIHAFNSSGIPVTYTITSAHDQSVTVAPVQVYNPTGPITGANVIQVDFPVVNGSTNGGGYSLDLKGVVQGAENTSNNALIAQTEDVVGMVVDSSGAITAGTASTTISGIAALSPSIFNITGTSIATGGPGNLLNVALSPTITGSAPETAYWTGTARLLWRGSSWSAPYLSIP